MVHCVDELGVLEEPYQTKDNMARKKGFVIKVQELYRWKNLPVAKVLFCDCQRFAEMLRNNSTGGTQLMGAFYSATWLHLVKRIQADQEVRLTLLPGPFSCHKGARKRGCTRALIYILRDRLQIQQ